MAYESGAYTDQYDLLAKIKTFLDTGGGDGTWTVNSYIANTQKYPSGVGAGQYRLHIHKGSLYFNLKSCNDSNPWEFYAADHTFSGIALYGSTGYSGAGNWDKEPGYPYGTTTAKPCGVCISSITSAGTYYFFSSTDLVIICVEYTGGKYQWLCFGQIQKLGAFTGGEFFSGSNSSYDTNNGITLGGSNPRFLAHSFYQGEVTFVRLNDAGYNTWRTSGSYRADLGITTTKQRCRTSMISSGRAITASYNYVLGCDLIVHSPNSFSGVAPFVPVYVFAERADGFFSPLGYLDIIRSVNMQYKSAGDEIVFGADTWVLFPQHNQSGDSITDIGFAIKKIV